jgi:cysteine sulfinate desulfinase/cysteine desulfurase-like protein
VAKSQEEIMPGPEKKDKKENPKPLRFTFGKDATEEDIDAFLDRILEEAEETKPTREEEKKNGDTSCQ